MTTAAGPLSLSRARDGAARRAWRFALDLQTNPLIVVGGLIVLVFLLVALVGPAVSPYPPLLQDIAHARQWPSGAHWFGTDELGRDLLSRIMAGARITLVVSVSTLVLAGGLGVGLGLLTGYLGGWVDRVLMRLVDVQLAVPGLVLALVIVSVIGASLNALILAVSVFSYPSFTRLTRSVTLKIREEEYIRAADAIGVPAPRVITRHLLPNVLPHVLALATVTLGRVVLAIAGLGFLGFGVEPGTPEWGTMVSQGRSLFLTLPYLVFFPGMAIAIVVLGFNLLGDGVRDYLDPRLRGR